MLSKAEQAHLNLEQARTLRSAGIAYREIGRRLGLTSSQLSHIRRALKREKGARTRLRSSMPEAMDRDLPVRSSVLPSGLRRTLIASGYRTLGDLADRLADPLFPGFETIAGIGRHKAERVTRLLDQFALRAGSSDLQADIERLFPEFSDALSARPRPDNEED